ncbi:ATP-binding protein [Shewanella baltica]|uniref:ATP-binding protein n=1 Tax=Shewanella TaxID=22 RepID=UPI00217E97CD|nr:ATP-binding protein [Shewanella baltica]MCS6153651.1 ATP-binding protein [Shewanella baltica]
MNFAKLVAPIEFNPTELENGILQIQAPVEMCLYSILEGNIEVARSTLNFLSTIADVTLLQHGYLHLDFSLVTKITAAASVLIFAEITRAQLATNQSDVITFSLPKSLEQAKLFKASGLYKAIMPGTSRKLIKLFDDNHSYQSGVDPNKFLVSTLLNLHNNGLELTTPEAKLISKGIQEAMLNVIHHAYFENQDQRLGIGSRWWQLVHCDPREKRVTFIIYDKGASIPSTIRPSSSVNLSDADAIEYAYTKGVTRLVGTTRGKGSEDIKDAAKVKDKSTLIVMSGRGMYFIDNGSGNGLKSPLPHNINGTLIEWSIPYE